MARILVLFESNNLGHTAKMTELVAEGAARLEGIEIRLLAVGEATIDDLRWIDGLAIGSPTNLGGISWRMKKWWDDLGFDIWKEFDGKIGCAFSSSGSWDGGNEHACQALCTLMMNFGKLVFGVTDYVAPEMSPHYGAVCAGAPRTEAEQEMCRRLGQRLAEWWAVYADGRKECHPVTVGYDCLIKQ